METISKSTVSADTRRTASELRVLIGRLCRRLRQPEANDVISLSQISVLGRLDREGETTPGALAAAERIRPQSMGATLASLEELGLIARSPDAADGRRVQITLTEAGREMIQGMRRVREEQIGRALTDGFTAEEIQTLSAVLPLLDRLVRLL